MARLPRISKPRIPKPLTSPSAAYGLPQATGSPSGFYGGGQAAPPAGGAPVGGGMGAGLGAGSGSTGSTLPRIGGTLGGVPMVRTQQQPDPYAALSEAELRSRTLAQISATYDPLIAQITSSYEQRAAAGGQAIKGITDQLVQQMRGYQGSAANIYGQAQQSQAASDAALSSMLSGQGTQLASELGSRLASINAPAATQGAQQAVTQAGTGSAGALYGKGSASQSDLIARGAGAQEYAAKLPGIAGLAGLQQLGQFQGQISGAEQDELGRLRSQIPGATADLLNSLRTTEMQKAGARTQQQQYEQSRTDTLAGRKASQASSAASLAERRREFGIQQQGVQAAAQAQQATAQAKLVQSALSRQDAQDKRLSQETGQVFVNGKPVMIKGQPVSTVEARRLAQQGTIAAARLDQSGRIAQAKLQQTGSLAQAKLTQQQQAQTQKADTERQRIVVSKILATGLYEDPNGPIEQNGKRYNLTPKARAALTSARGFDPITGKPSAKTQISQENAATARQRAAETAAHNKATERLAASKTDAQIGSLNERVRHDVATERNQAASLAERRQAAHDRITAQKQIAALRTTKAKAPSVSDQGTKAKWEGTAESFASVMYNGGKDPNGNDIAPQTYEQALAQAKRLDVPFNVAQKHLKAYYAHGNKQVHDFVTDPSVSFTLDAQGRVAALKDGKLVRYMRRGKPGYSVALQRAKARK